MNIEFNENTNVEFTVSLKDTTLQKKYALKELGFTDRQLAGSNATQISATIQSLLFQWQQIHVKSTWSVVEE